MAKVEKKFRVESLDDLKEKLKTLGVNPDKTSHYTSHYALPTGTIIRKIIKENGNVRIVELKDKGSVFEFTQRLPMPSMEAAKQWLKDRGHNTFKAVKTDDSVYEYKGGRIELISLNDGAVYAVTLLYEQSRHDEILQDLDIADAEQITVPFSEMV